LKGKYIRLLGVLLLLAILSFSLIAPVTYAPYQEQNYYQQSRRALDSVRQTFKMVPGDTIAAGWSSKNITPQEPLKLMGYGWKGDYLSIHDSLKVRTMVFSDGQQTIALLTYDLMIVHPDLAAAVRQAVRAALPAIDGLYFSAVHTHTGYGEWARGLGGQLTAGGYNKSAVDFIVQQSLAAVREALSAKQTVSIGYAEYPRPHLVQNRLVREDTTDHLLRVLKLKQVTGPAALLCTFSAHATLTSSRSMALSADYPAALTKELESHPEIEFAAFAAGAVGSHRPLRVDADATNPLAAYAQELAQPVLNEFDKIETSYSQKMHYATLPLVLGKAQLKISKGWKVRDWVFRAFFGELEPTINFLQLNDIVLIATPADFSGLLYPALKPNGKHLIVSSFNGSYIGYVIPDRYYHHSHREARELNWFGPYTGSYVTELINRLLAIANENA